MFDYVYLFVLTLPLIVKFIFELKQLVIRSLLLNVREVIPAEHFSINAMSCSRRNVLCEQNNHTNSVEAFDAHNNTTQKRSFTYHPILIILRASYSFIFFIGIMLTMRVSIIYLLVFVNDLFPNIYTYMFYDQIA